MYCKNCGNELDSNDKFCGKCGTPCEEQKTTTTSTSTTTANPNNDKIIYAVIGFFAPIVGIILSLATKKDKPEAAKIGLIVSIIKLVLEIFSIIIRIIFYAVM